MIELAKRRVKSPNIEFLETDGQTIPYGNDTFDFILSNAVFHHMPSLKIVEANFREAFRVLRPGGLFKVQLRGSETSKKNWWYGISFSEKKAVNLSTAIGFKVIESVKFDRKVNKNYLWLLLQK